MQRRIRRLYYRVPTWALALLFIVSMMLIVILTGIVPHEVV